ncbi:MAG: hypothetical protein AAFO15_00950 [Pseudomonadota bacterium]
MLNDIRISLEVEFYLLGDSIDILRDKLTECLKFPFAVVPEVAYNQYEISVCRLSIQESIEFINELQKVFFYFKDVYAFPFFDDTKSPNGLHINFISNNFNSMQYTYSLADFLCDKLNKVDINDLLQVGKLDFIVKKDREDVRKMLKISAYNRYISNCIYVPKVLLFSNRFNRTTAIRLIKGYDNLFRLEFRLGYLYCNFSYLLLFLIDAIRDFNNLKLDYDYLTYVLQYDAQIGFE